MVELQLSQFPFIKRRLQNPKRTRRNRLMGQETWQSFIIIIIEATALFSNIMNTVGSWENQTTHFTTELLMTKNHYQQFLRHYCDTTAYLLSVLSLSSCKKKKNISWYIVSNKVTILYFCHISHSSHPWGAEERPGRPLLSFFIGILTKRRWFRGENGRVL